MIVERVVVGDYQTNCYILSIGNDCLVIDPGDEYEKIMEFVSNKKILGVLLTHRHFDHIGALDLLNDNGKFKTYKTYEYNNVEEKEYKIGSFKFKIIYTKGHTDDSITYYFEKDKVMFVGDFVFENSIGRTDLPTGNYSEMLKSIDIIKKYDDDILIYPGHGNATKLGIEKINNLWFDNVNS
ncbi:MAG: MBL fold metallo-hydrolase [Bacilli bacterium]|nr:MBL fold metallo-hydrolase [Bacilli bacterium]